MAGVWDFRVMARGEVNVDPFEGEFFTTEALPDLTHALVRETIQNSLDAAWRGETVRVRFAVHDARHPADLFGERSDPRGLQAVLADLYRHLQAPTSGVDPPERDAPLRWLVIEDFGTRGLEGDTEQFEDVEPDSRFQRNDFYYFWRNVGRSGKIQGERGRWGIGKTVFPASSRINTFFGLTVRRSDGRTLLMGQAVLKIHKIEGRRHAPYGYYGRHQGQLALPLAAREEIDAFRVATGLSRTDEAGLSIVIPYADDEITCESLIGSVIDQYFLPLVGGQLVVEVREGTHDAIRLDAAGLDAAVRRSRERRRHERLRLIQLARLFDDLPAEARATLRSPPAGRAPKFDEDLIDRSDLERLRRRYEAGRPVLIDGGVPVLPPGSEPGDERAAPREGRFKLLVQRDDQLRRGEGHYVRQGITISNGNTPRPRGVRWILLVTDSVLGALLGDAENPAHTEWQKSSPTLKKRYRLGPSTMGYVKSIPKNLCGLLSRPAQGRDRGLLQRIFSISRAAALRGPEGAKASGEAVPEEAATREVELPATTARGPRLQVTRIQSGFRLTGECDGARELTTLDIRLAYEVRRGNPFSRYVPLDFEVDKEPIRITASGVAVIQSSRNMIRVRVSKPRFRLEAHGFDPHRDLRIKVLPNAEDQP